MSPSVAAAPVAAAAEVATTRSLLLAPPSLSSHPEALNRIVEAHDRSRTDIQMLDRLALGLVSLPEATYDVVLLLTDADGSRTESQKIFDRKSMAAVVRALRPGGLLKSQDGLFASFDGPEKTEAILAGLLARPGEGMYKPSYMGAHSIPLKFGKKATTAAPPMVQPSTEIGSNGLSPGKRKIDEASAAVPAGVGFVDFSDDLYTEPLEDGEEDELIDEDTLLTEEDMARPVIIPPECQPKAGKRRRACKDCTCGLKQKLEAEDNAKRTAADNALSTLKLGADDLTEVDFTVQGKVGSCGNCALGDAFRCDGCPYIGLPAFKPGEEVRLLNNDIQL